MTELRHQFSCSLPAPRERVWRALTEAEELAHWFTDHADVDLRPGGAFRFWGRSSYGTPNEGEATQALLQLHPPERLAFSWTLHGKPSEVTFELSPTDPATQPEGTRLEVHHVFADAPDIARAKELVEDLWRLHCGNLAAYLTGDGGMIRPDFDDPSPAIRVSVRIAAPRARVFRALLEPEVLNRWIASAAEVEPRAGGRYAYGWNYEVDGRQVVGGPSRILELVEGERLVTDWPDWRGDPRVPVQKITWLLEDDGDGTRVTLIHSGFVRAADWSDYPFGWGHFLGTLKQAVEAPGN